MKGPLTMYARYIPPAKGSKPPPPKPAPAPASASPAFSSATPYARYVPPARSAHTPAATPAATPIPLSRAPPPSKTHLNAAAIPPPESLPPKIVFNYDDEPSPSKKRKLDSPEPAPETKEVKKSKKDKRDKSGEVKEKKEKKGKKRKDKKDDASLEEQQEDEEDSKREKATRNKKKNAPQPFAFEFDHDAAAAPEAVADSSSPVANGQASDVDKDAKTDPPKTKTKAGDVDAPNVKPTEKKRRRDSHDTPTIHKAILKKAATSLKHAQSIKAGEPAEPSQDEGAEPVEAHGLEPLPQPERVAKDSFKLTYDTLPAWIANPIRVTPETKASFTDLGISKEAAAKLELKGYESAFAIQTAILPLLLPSTDRQGDVVVSAATGSGKTLAYVLPMVRDIGHGVVTRLRSLIVVPTRELVLQAKEVCEACAGAFAGPTKKNVKIGISMGNKQFEQEQADLVEEELRYDPVGYEKWLHEHFRQDFDVDLFDDAPKPLPDHVVDYVSKVDILICTPGRLVDHINRTRGFTLDYVRWLVVDEADRLLAQTFQDWVSVVMPLLSTTNKPGARDFPDSNKSGVRKVVLSATMTRDLTLLNGLKLSRPRLITLEGVRDDAEEGRESKTEQHVLPGLLEEFAIKIRDPNLKPLYLVNLLSSAHMAPAKSASEDVKMVDAEEDDTSSAASESESSSSDDAEASSSDSSDSESDSDSSDVGSTDSPSRKHTAPSSTRSSKPTPFRTTVLIFTKSNETALRLSRLLSLLSPHLTPLIGTLTSTTRTSERRKTLRAFAAHKLRILVASDLVARGIDLAELDHVVNYDLPTSVASYVHRVGRTARAGRKGRSWTLYTKGEAGWFWTEVAGKGGSKSKGAAAGAGQIKRQGKVEEVWVDDRWEESRVEKFEGALEKLGREASEMRKRR